MKSSALYIVVFVTAAIFGLNHFKFEVREVKNEVKQLERELKKEQNSLHVLEAEWAYLNRPERLQRLSQKYFTLVPLSGTQLVTMKTIPQPPQEEEPKIVPAARVVP